MVNIEKFKHMNHLPDHKNLCSALLSFFNEQDGIIGAFVSGSGSAGGMDFHSDLDLGFLCSSDDAKEKVWSKRFDWMLPPWFHRMDADHVKPYFIIYLFEPHIHVDLVFYTKENLPPQAGGPYTIAFDRNAQLGNWLTEVNKPFNIPVDWSNVVHEEERIWTWIHYAWCHVGRGEYYDIAAGFAFLRDIPHSWYARMKGTERFNSRRLESRGESHFVEKMRLCYPMPDRASTKAALLNLIGIHNEQREQVDKLIRPQWKTTQSARDRITRLVSEI
ncbi:MAG: hypothetical protein IPK04_05085 [Bdellovibrionales bacterium]|nr:hypothetical protein [Bdellovibrionales bacterium]